MTWQGMEKRRGELLVLLNFSEAPLTMVSEDDGWKLGSPLDFELKYK